MSDDFIRRLFSSDGSGDGVTVSIIQLHPSSPEQQREIAEWIVRLLGGRGA